jgi:hypothetical protein
MAVARLIVHIPYIHIYTVRDVAICSMHILQIRKHNKMKSYPQVLIKSLAFIIYFIYISIIFIPVLTYIICRKATKGITNKPKKSLEYMAYWRYN